MLFSNKKVGFNVYSDKLVIANKILGVAIAFALPISTAATNIFFVLAAAMSCITTDWKAHTNFMRYNPLTWLFGGLSVIFFVGLCYTSAPLPYALGMSVKYVKFLLAVLLLPLFIEERWRSYAVNAFLLAIGAMLFCSYLKTFGLIQYTVSNGGPVEVFKGHIDFSFLLAFASYLVILKMLRQPKYLWWWLVFLVLIVFNMFFLGIGRSGYFIFAILLCVMFLQQLKWKGLIFAIISINLLAVFMYNFSPTFQVRINDIVSDVKTYCKQPQIETSVGMRLDFIKHSLLLIKAHPVIGTGTGSFKYEYEHMQPRPQKFIDNPHNEYLNFGVQFGVIGMSLLGLLFLYQLYESRRLPDDIRYISQAVIIAMLLGCLGNSWLRDTTEGHLYAYFMVLAFAALPQIKKRRV